VTARFRLLSAARAERLARAASHVVPVALVVFVGVEWNGIPGQVRDTAAYHHAAAAAAGGGPLYDGLQAGPLEIPGEWPYIYPPPFAALLSLLPEFGYRTFDRLWLIANLIAFWLLAGCLARLARGRWSVRGTARWGGALFFMPGTLLAIHFGNIDLMLLAVAAVAAVLPGTAGFGLGMAAAVKVVAGWPLLAMAVRRPAVALPGFAAAAAVCIAASAAVFGIGQTVDLTLAWVRDVMPTLAQGQFWGESLDGLKAGGLSPWQYTGNLSLSFLPVQLAVLGGWDYSGGPLPAPVRLYLTGVAMLAPVTAAWLTRRHAVEFQMAVVLAAALLAAPIVRPYVLPVLLLVLAAWRSHKRARAVKPGTASNGLE
jgi:hypothetical protein